MWIPCPPTNKPSENVETSSTFQTSFLEEMLGELGRLSCLELATERSPHSADGSSAAGISPGGFSAAGLWKAQLDAPLTRVPRERRQLLALRSHFSSVLVSPLLSTGYCLSPCCHRLRRCSLTVRTLCLRREECDDDPPAVTTRNLIGV